MHYSVQHNKRKKLANIGSRHTDPRRQRPQLAQEYAAPAIVTSNCATVTIFVPHRRNKNNFRTVRP